MKILLISLLMHLSITLHAETFVFTAIPDEDETQLITRFSKVADYLSKSLGIDVQYMPVKSYPAAVSAFRNNQVQLAWFGGLTGVQARRLVPGSEAIAQGKEDPAFKSYFIAHSSTGLKPQTKLPTDISNMTFTFGSKSSTSGRLMPEFFLRETFKQTPQQLFSRVGYSGNHSRTLALVQSGAYQLGALNYKVWDKALQAGEIDTDKVSIIWQTPLYPDYQWTVRGDVNDTWGPKFKAKLTHALVTMKDPTLLKAFPRQAFIPASNQEFEAILNVAQSIGLID